MRRIFIPHENINGDIIETDQEAQKHIVKVLRMKEKDKFIAEDGSGIEYVAEIISFDKKSVRAKIVERKEKIDNGININLYMSMIKPTKFEIVLEKMAEIGVKKIVPIISKNCGEFQLNENKKARWNSILNQATRQCAGSFIPLLEDTIKFQEAIKQAELDSTILFPDPSGKMSWLQIKDSINTKDKISIFIGPEGGFTKEEVEFAKNANAFILNLGERILRAETAAISVASIVQFCLK